MKKLVSIEQIRSWVKPSVVYAEKHDELEFVVKHDDEFSVYMNVRTNTKFITKEKNVTQLNQADIFLFVEKEKKKQINNSRTKKDDKNQMEIF